MDNDQRLTAIQAKAEGMGLGFETKSDEGQLDFRLYAPMDNFQEGSWEFDGYADSKGDIEAAHALIAWWKRRGWVECSECKGLKAVGKWVVSGKDYTYTITECPGCHGEGRMSPGG